MSQFLFLFVYSIKLVYLNLVPPYFFSGCQDPVLNSKQKTHSVYFTLFVLLTVVVETLRLTSTHNPLLRAICADTFMT